MILGHIEEGEVTTVSKINTIADGTAVQTPGDKLFPYLQANVDHVITVDDSELTLSFLDMAENHKMIVSSTPAVRFTLANTLCSSLITLPCSFAISEETAAS